MDTVKGNLFIDGFSLLYRAHFAFIRNPLTNSRGFETSALFGFARMVFDLLDRFKPDRVVVALDRGRLTFRSRLYPEYKAHRDETPAPLIAQIPHAREFLEALGVPIVEKDDYEADDLLGTMAIKFAGKGESVVVVTGDRDLLQLVRPGLATALTKKGITELAVYGTAEIQAELGVTPLQLVDVKALMGDTSDNIPGVAGIGEKTALKLIAQYGSLEGIYDHLDELPKGQRAKLEVGRESAYLSRTLGTICLDAPIGDDVSLLERRPADGARLHALFTELELRAFNERPEIKGSVPVASPTVSAEVITDREALGTLAGRVVSAPAVTVMAVTLREVPRGQAGLVGLGLSTGPGECFYVPMAHAYLGVPSQLSTADVVDGLGGAMSRRPWVGHDLKAQVTALRPCGLEPGPLEFDTQVASYVVDASRRSHALEDLVAEQFGQTLSEPRPPQDSDRGQLTVEATATWVAACLESVRAIAVALRERLAATESTDLFESVEMPLVGLLEEMERSGILLEPSVLRDLSVELATELGALEKQIWERCGETFNVNSPSQLGRILFEKMGYPVLRKTKTGPSTDADVLAALEHDHGLEVAGMINRYRHLNKLKGTYVDVLPTLINPATGRIHTRFQQTVAATGRLSSIDPNLQNIPIRTPVGMRIRSAFHAADGCLLVGADYSQIELRILAHLTGSPFLAQAFATGVDIHQRTAARMFGVSEESVTSELRSRAKAINFGILYGMSAFGLAREVGISQAAAKEFIETYFAQFPEVKAYMDQTVAEARAKGHVTTLLNRRRPLPGLASRNPAERAFAERIAINTPVQGSAADLIKVAMGRVHGRLAREVPSARMILQIHDELVMECPASDADQVGRVAIEEMSTALALSVPIVVNVHSGKTWADLK